MEAHMLADRRHRLERARAVCHHGEQIGHEGQFARFHNVVENLHPIGGKFRAGYTGDTGGFFIVGHLHFSLGTALIAAWWGDAARHPA